jgi:integrase
VVIEVDRKHDVPDVPFKTGSPVVVDGEVTKRKLVGLLRHCFEYPELDYKNRIDLAKKPGQVELAKDIGAFQVLGGYIVAGADDHGRLTGGMDGASQRAFDEGRLVPMMEKYLPKPVKVEAKPFKLEGHDLVLLYVHPNPLGLSIFWRIGQYDKGGENEIVFREGDIFWRNGTRSERITYDDLAKIIDWRVAKGIADIESGSREPLHVAIERFLRDERPKRKWSKRTVEDYGQILRKLDDPGRERTLAFFEPKSGGTERLRSFVHENWSDRSVGTQRTKIFTLQSFFRWCYRVGLMDADPAERLSIPPKPVTTRRAPSLQVVDGLVAAQDYLPDRIMILLFARIGLRKGEAAELRYRDFDLIERQVRVHPTTRHPERHKPIKDAELLDYLRTMKVIESRDGVEFVIHPRRLGNLSREELLLGRARSENPMKPLEPSSIQRRFKECLKHAPGMPDLKISDLRLLVSPDDDDAD